MNRVMRDLKSVRRPAFAGIIPAGEPVRLPIHFFAVAIFFFALGTAAAPWAAARLADYFYQLSVLAWVHTFTLGWITSAILGLIYCYVPAFGRRGLRFPRLAALQLVLYFLGASGVIAHFMLGSWDGVWMAGAVVALSVVLFALNVVPALAPDFGRGTAETGLLLGLFFLLCASSLGTMLAFDKEHSFIPGTLLRNLSAHAHLAAIGWIAMAVCGVSYRLSSAAESRPTPPGMPAAAIAQLFALAAAAMVLFAALMARIGNVAIWTVFTAAVLMLWLAIFQRRIRVLHTPALWTTFHALAAVVSLVLVLIAGIWLAVAGAGGAFGAHLACAYGLLGLLGFAGNFIIALSYHLFSGFVARVRSALGWPHLSRAELSVDGGRPLAFWGLNAGILMMAAGLLADRVEIAQVGGVLIAIAGLVYSAAMAWTLSFAYRRSSPEAPGRLLSAAQD